MARFQGWEGGNVGPGGSPDSMGSGLGNDVDTSMGLVGEVWRNCGTIASQGLKGIPCLQQQAAFATTHGDTRWFGNSPQQNICFFFLLYWLVFSECHSMGL